VLLPVYEGFPILKKMWLKMKFPALEKKKERFGPNGVATLV